MQNQLFELPVLHRRQNKERPPLRGWWGNPRPGDRSGERTNIAEFFIVSPYDGYCSIGCQFCFQNNPKYDVNSGENITILNSLLRYTLPKKLDEMYYGFPGLFNYFTEPFNILEESYHLTQFCIEEFTKRNLPVCIMTRKAVPAWCIQELKKNKDSYVQISINTSNPETWHKLSPQTDNLDILYCSIKELTTQGIHVTLRIDPIIPGITKLNDILSLIDTCISLGVQHVTASFLRYSNNGSRLMLERLGQIFPYEYPELIEKMDQKWYGVTRANTIYRMNTIDKMLLYINKRVSFSLDREYMNVGKKQVANMNDLYMIGTQIDTGKAVPVYMRLSLEDKFQPLPRCKGNCINCETASCKSYALATAENRMPKLLRTANAEIKEAIKLGKINL